MERVISPIGRLQHFCLEPQEMMSMLTVDSKMKKFQIKGMSKYSAAVWAV
jgi:hypothetical protein